MRYKLGRINEVRATFTATFERYGTKSNWHGFPEKTLLFKDVRDSSGRIVADHIWFTVTKAFDALGVLDTGVSVQFDARVKPYVKGYQGHREEVDKPVETDYKLSRPTKIKKSRCADE